MSYDTYINICIYTHTHNIKNIFGMQMVDEAEKEAEAETNKNKEEEEEEEESTTTSSNHQELYNKPSSRLWDSS